MFGRRPPSVSSAHGHGTPPAQRRFLRAAVDLPAAYLLADGAQPCAARVVVLSAGGVRFETAEDLPSGTPLELRFALKQREIVAKGHVVMSYFDAVSKRFGHGLAFTAIDPNAQDAIAAHVAELTAG